MSMTQIKQGAYMSIEELLYKKYNKIALNKLEVQEELGVSKSGLDALRRDGKIESFHIGSQVRFSLEAVAKVLKDGTK